MPLTIWDFVLVLNLTTTCTDGKWAAKFWQPNFATKYVIFATKFLDSAQKESRFPTGHISLHCNGVDECGQIISTVLCLQWL